MARPKREESPGRLSPSEWEIMMICWRLGRANVRQILREDLKTRIRDYRTILTFVSRIAKKGWLEVEMDRSRDRISHVQLIGDTLYVQTERSVVEAIDAETGDRWISSDQVLGVGAVVGPHRQTGQTGDICDASLRQGTVRQARAIFIAQASRFGRADLQVDIDVVSSAQINKLTD